MRSFSTLLVDDIAKVVRFLQDSFETSPPVDLEEQFPFQGVSLTIEGGGSFLVVPRRSLSKKALSVLRCLNHTRYISIQTDDVEGAKQRLIEVGGADLIEVAGGERRFESASVLLGGPEDLYIHVTGSDAGDEGNLLHGSFMSEVLQHAGLSMRKKEKKKPKEPDLNPRPLFPSLDVRVKSNRSKTQWTACPPNSRKAIPFETDLFKGTTLILLRTDPVDATYSDFFCGKRQFEVQVQGKFKHLPAGDIYVGAETTCKMELGIMSRVTAKTFLAFTKSMVSDLHYSFGDDPHEENFQVHFCPVLTLCSPSSLSPLIPYPYSDLAFC